jgi:AcrR family transcriptional regulator
MAARKSQQKSRPAARRPPRSSPRAPGRPRQAGPDQRERLIDAALTCYVRQGIRATSVRDIAAEAGVTPALLHYYFGDAAKLLDKAIAERLLPVFQSVRGPLQQADVSDPWILAETFVTAVCDAIDAHPWWPALWVREVISEGGALRDLLVKRIGPDLRQIIIERFEKAQATGRLNAALEPRLMVVTLIGLTLFPAAGAPIWRGIFDARDITMKDVRAHALALLSRGLEARP